MLREKVAIITDSCADVPEELAEKYHLFVLPMQIVCEDGVYRDGIDMTSEDIYKRLEKETPKSSTPSGADVEDLLQELVRQGYKKAIAVLLAGGLSGTVNQVRLLAEEFGGIAIQTAKYAEEGMEFEELKEKVERLIERTKVFFSIDTLKYLKRGGRIGKAAALAGTLLDIKPVMSFDEDGEIYAAAKVRSRKGVEKRLLQLMEDVKREGCPYNLMVADGGAAEEREALEEKLKERFPDYQAIYRAKIGAALSVHLGPGLLGAGIQYLEN